MTTNAHASHEIVLSDGARMTLRRYGQPGKPRLVFSHGNGLAIDGYRVFWSQFCEAFDVIVFDMRNHGVNPTHELAAHNFERMARDLAEIWTGIESAFGAMPTAGLFHSMSAIASVEHLANYGPACDALVLFDPPVYPPPGHPLEARELADMHELTARARRRPQAYASPLDLAAQFSRRRAFSNWVSGAAEDLARATLRHDPQTGQWVLACPRDFEAKIYETNSYATTWDVLTGDLPVPVLVLAGDPDLPGQGPPALLCQAMARLSSFEYVALDGTSHFLQIEQPQRCADEVLRFLRTRVPALAAQF